MGLEKISQYKKKMNLTTEELSEKSGVPIGTLNKILSGATKDPKLETLKAIAKVLGLSLNDFDDEIPQKNVNDEYSKKNYILENNKMSSEHDRIKKYRFIDKHSPDGVKVVDMVLEREYFIATQLKERSECIPKAESPIISSDIENNIDMRLINYYYRVASAGTGQIIFDMPPTKRIEIPNTPEYQKVDYAIGVNGNSMEPTFHDGDMLLVEMTEDIEIGDIGIFRVDNESYVKKLGESELISLNPAADNIPLNETAGCMGKVIGKLPDD